MVKDFSVWQNKYIYLSICFFMYKYIILDKSACWLTVVIFKKKGIIWWINFAWNEWRKEGCIWMHYTRLIEHFLSIQMWLNPCLLETKQESIRCWISPTSLKIGHYQMLLIKLTFFWPGKLFIWILWCKPTLSNMCSICKFQSLNGFRNTFLNFIFADSRKKDYPAWIKCGFLDLFFFSQKCLTHWY